MIQIEKVVKKVKKEVVKRNMTKKGNVIDVNNLEMSNSYNYSIGERRLESKMKVLDKDNNKEAVMDLKAKYLEKYGNMEVKNKAQLELYKKNLNVAYSEDIRNKCERVLVDSVKDEVVHKGVYDLLVGCLRHKIGFPLYIEVKYKYGKARMLLEITDFKINKYGYREPVYTRIG